MSKINTIRQIKNKKFEISNSNNFGTEELEKELKWNNRFHLGKLPDYNSINDVNYLSLGMLKKTFKTNSNSVGKKNSIYNVSKFMQQSPIPLNGEYLEVDAEELNILQSMWDEVGVKQEYRTSFNSFTSELQENIRKEFFELEISSLKKLSETLHKLMKEIQNREKTISILVKCDEAIVKESGANEKLLNDIFQCTKNIRIHSINIVNHFTKIREMCSYSLIGGKFDLEKINKSYMFDTNYLIKMKYDLEFLKNSSISRYFYIPDNPDPFLVETCDSLDGKYSTKINQDMLSSIKMCQFVILQDVIFYLTDLKRTEKNKKYSSPNKIKLNLNYPNIKNTKSQRAFSPHNNLNSEFLRPVTTNHMNKVKNETKYDNLFLKETKDRNYKNESNRIYLESRGMGKTQQNFNVFNISNSEKNKFDKIKYKEDIINSKNFSSYSNFKNLEENLYQSLDKQSKENNQSYDTKYVNNLCEIENKFKINNKETKNVRIIENKWKDNIQEYNQKNKLEKNPKFKNCDKLDDKNPIYIESAREYIEHSVEDNKFYEEDMRKQLLSTDVLNEKNYEKNDEIQFIQNKENILVPDMLEEEIIEENEKTKIFKSEKIINTHVDNTENIDYDFYEKYDNTNKENFNNISPVKEKTKQIPDSQITNKVTEDINVVNIPNSKKSLELSVSYYTGYLSGLSSKYSVYVSKLNKDQVITFKPADSIYNCIKGINPKILLAHKSDELIGICCIYYDLSSDTSLRLQISHISTLLHDDFEIVVNSFKDYIFKNCKFDELMIEIYYELIDGNFIMNKYLFGILKEKLKFKWSNLENRDNERLQKMSLVNPERKNEINSNYRNMLDLKHTTVLKLDKFPQESVNNSLTYKEQNINLFPFIYLLVNMNNEKYIIGNEMIEKCNYIKMKHISRKFIKSENGDKDDIRNLLGTNFESLDNNLITDLNICVLSLVSNFASIMTFPIEINNKNYLYNRIEYPRSETLVDSETSQEFHVIPTGDGSHSILVAQLNEKFNRKLILHRKNICEFFYSIYPYLENAILEEHSNRNNVIWIPSFKINSHESFKSPNLISDLIIKRESEEYKISFLDECNSFNFKFDNDYRNSFKTPVYEGIDVVVREKFLISIVNFDVLTQMNIPSIFLQVVNENDWILAD